jgi:hypothetical protein
VVAAEGQTTPRPLHAELRGCIAARAIAFIAGSPTTQSRSQPPNGPAASLAATGNGYFRNSSDSLAMFTAILRASSLLIWLRIGRPSSYSYLVLIPADHRA